jgi:insulysin
MSVSDRLGIQAADVQAFIPEILSSLHIETLIHGNTTKEEALALSRVVQETLEFKPLDYDSIIGPRSLLLPHGTRCFMCSLTVSGTKVMLEKPVPNPENANSGIDYFCQTNSVTDDKNRVLLLLLSQIGAEKAFDFLRTKLQLGYWISSGLRGTVSIEGFLGSITWLIFRYRILIQSEKPPSLLEEKIETFLDILRKSIVEMSPEEYASHISSLVLSLSEKSKSLGQEASECSGYIRNGFYDFNSRKSLYIRWLINLRREGHYES